jgi:hypothetical protein
MKTYLMVVGIAAMLVSNAAAQTWQYTGSLNTERRLSTINILQNGKVLVTGGDDMAGNALASCEIYDPATATWSYVASMNNPRDRHTSNELPDGRIVIIGGNTNNVYQNAVTASVEIYDPLTDTWVEDGLLQVGRQNHTSTLLNDSLILVSAGDVNNWPGSGCTAECEIYNVNSHQSTIAGSMTQPRRDFSAVLLADERVLVTGGRTGGSVSDYLSECEIYDPSTNSWSVVPSMVQPRESGLLMRFSDNTVIAAGGRSSIYVTAPGAEVFNPANPTWISVSPIMQPCAWPGATVLSGDRLLMTGGIITFDPNDPSGQTVNNTATCEWYDKPNERWFYAPTMHESRAEHGAITMTQNVNPYLPTQMALVVGGIISPSDVTNTCEVLDVGSNALTHYMEQPQNTASIATTIIANAMKVVYGENGPAVDLTLAGNGNVATELVSIDGHVVFNLNESLAAGEHILSLPANLGPGMYLMRVSIGTNVMSSKILITQ